MEPDYEIWFFYAIENDMAIHNQPKSNEDVKLYIDKIINNNIISAKDSMGVELIAMGKGIGFGQKPGNEIDDAAVEKIFRLENMDDKEHFKELLGSLPLDYIRLSTDIISYAKDSLGLKLSQNVYLTLTDHISFAINRHREGMNFGMVLYDEIKLFYPLEYSVGRYALELIEERLNLRLAEDEAACIALHIINGELNTEMGTTFVMVQMMREMMEIIDSQITVPEGGYYPRGHLISDLKQLVNRLVSEEPISGREDKALYQFVKDNYQEDYQIIEQVRKHIEQQYQCNMTTEEKVYLVLSIKRMRDLYTC